MAGSVLQIQFLWEQDLIYFVPHSWRAVGFFFKMMYLGVSISNYTCFISSDFIIFIKFQCLKLHSSSVQRSGTDELCSLLSLSQLTALNNTSVREWYLVTWLPSDHTGANNADVDVIWNSRWAASPLTPGLITLQKLRSSYWLQKSVLRKGSRWLFGLT